MEKLETCYVCLGIKKVPDTTGKYYKEPGQISLVTCPSCSGTGVHKFAEQKRKLFEKESS